MAGSYDEQSKSEETNNNSVSKPVGPKQVSEEKKQHAFYFVKQHPEIKSELERLDQIRVINQLNAKRVNF